MSNDERQKDRPPARPFEVPKFPELDFGVFPDLESTELELPGQESRAERRARTRGAGRGESEAPVDELGDPTLSARPYLTGVAVGVAAMAVGVVIFDMPLASVSEFGLTFLALALLVRFLEDAEDRIDSPVVRWLADRAAVLEARWGFGMYGLVGLTTFLLAETRSLANTDVSISELLADPLSEAIRWFVAESVESIMNAVWAAVWFVDLMEWTGAYGGTVAFLGTIGAAWAVWRVLMGPDSDNGS